MNTPITTIQPPAPLDGDVDQNGVVDMQDLQAIVADFGKTSGYCSRCDAAASGAIDLFDVMVVVRNWGRAG